MQQSLDHSWVNELLQDGEITKEEVNGFREKNVITRALGTNPEVKVDWKIEKICDGDIYLLCSDGLHGEIKDEKIGEILKSKGSNCKFAVNSLIKAANDAGGSDNITAIVLKVKGEELPLLPLRAERSLPARGQAPSRAERSLPAKGQAPSRAERSLPARGQAPYRAQAPAGFLRLKVS